VAWLSVLLNGKFSNALIRLVEGSSEKVNKLRLFVEKIKSNRLPNFRLMEKINSSGPLYNELHLFWVLQSPDLSYLQIFKKCQLVFNTTKLVTSYVYILQYLHVLIKIDITRDFFLLAVEMGPIN
jgi:hypothetical protein